jgi:site-specific recombinase XerD
MTEKTDELMVDAQAGIDRFLDALWMERSLNRNTLAAADVI